MMSWPASPRTRMRPIGPAIADAGRAAAADLLGRRQIGQVGPMALARVDDQQAGGAPGRQQAAVRLDRAAQLRHVVAEHFAEAAGLEEVALHVDDEQRAVLRARTRRDRARPRASMTSFAIAALRDQMRAAGPEAERVMSARRVERERLSLVRGGRRMEALADLTLLHAQANLCMQFRHIACTYSSFVC